VTPGGPGRHSNFCRINASLRKTSDQLCAKRIVAHFANHGDTPTQFGGGAGLVGTLTTGE